MKKKRQNLCTQEKGTPGQTLSNARQIIQTSKELRITIRVEFVRQFYRPKLK